jgi:gamma-glutamyl-gamma-aminobutyrate hydrolase PuuD
VSVPLVGVTTYVAEAAWGPWRRPAAVLTAAYFELVARSQCRPVLLPPCHEDGAGGALGAAEVAAAIDALVLVGGGDVEPSAYGGGTHREVAGTDPVRDASERALLAAALDADLPVLAICRGLQVLNVELGGTLTLHLPDVTGNDDHRPGPGAFSEVEVETVAGTAVAAMVGPRATVRCSHHQALDRLGAGLVVSARSVGHPGSHRPDGVVEAAELPDRRFVVGLQWHPEESQDLRPFEALAAAARAA